jgi:hypothetical protein
VKSWILASSSACVEAVLNVHHGLTGVRTDAVRKHVRADRVPRFVERRERVVGGAVQRQRERSSALRPRDPQRAMFEIDLIPPQAKETATAKACVRRENDLLHQIRRRRAHARARAQDALLSTLTVPE